MDRFVIVKKRVVEEEEEIIDLTNNEKTKKRKREEVEEETTVGSTTVPAPKRIGLGKITGIDPGPVSLCLSQIDISSGELVQCRNMPLREKKEKVSVGVLLDRLKALVDKDEYGFFKNSVTVAVEDQREGENVFNLAIQHGFQTLLGTKRCMVVNGNSLKAHYRKHFPRHSAEMTPRDGYKANKKNAVKAGILTTTHKEQARIIAPKEFAKDAYDSLWIARFALDSLFPSRTPRWYQ